MGVALALAACTHRVMKVLHQLAWEAPDVDDVLQEADDLLVLLRRAFAVEHGLDSLPCAHCLVARHPHDA